MPKHTKITEDDIQIAVMKFVGLHKEIAGLVIHCPNEGKRSVQYGRKLKRMGVRAGVSDLQIIRAKHGYHGAFIEIKTEKGKPTKSQLQFIEDVTKEGYFGTVTYGLDDTLETVKWYLGM